MNRTESGGNVFRDLGLDDADKLLIESLRQQLAEAERENEELRKAFDERVRVIEMQLKDKEVLQAELAALKAGAEPVGKRLTNAEMGIGWDRRAGEIIWWDMPPQGSYLYTTPPTATALVEDFKRRAVEVCKSYFEQANEKTLHGVGERFSAIGIRNNIESMPLIEGEKK